MSVDLSDLYARVEQLRKRLEEMATRDRITADSIWTQVFSGNIATSTTVNVAVQVDNGGMYLVTVMLYNGLNERTAMYALSSLEAQINVGWDLLHNKVYAGGAGSSIALATQNGGGQYGFNAASNGQFTVSMTTAASGPCQYTIKVTRVG